MGERLAVISDRLAEKGCPKTTTSIAVLTAWYNRNGVKWVQPAYHITNSYTQDEMFKL